MYSRHVGLHVFTFTVFAPNILIKARRVFYYTVFGTRFRSVAAAAVQIQTNLRKFQLLGFGDGRNIPVNRV